MKSQTHSHDVQYSKFFENLCDEFEYLIVMLSKNIMLILLDIQYQKILADNYELPLVYFFGYTFCILQMERDDRTTEVDILKDKLEKTQAQVTRAHDEKDAANREFERALEKFDK